MAKRWHEIPGWCSYEITHLYDEAVSNAKDGDIFVEAGCYLGRSTQYMIECIEKSKKNIIFDVIDNWEEDYLRDNKGGTFYDFLKNVKTERIRNIIKGDSIESCSRYKKGEIKFLFLDTAHTYDHVKKEILSWSPKVNHTIAGHDYNHTGCKKAVDEMFESISIRRYFGSDIQFSSWSYTFN